MQNEDSKNLQQEELEKSILIYFFLTVGIPDSLSIELI